ncbi:hypothetical protein JCM4814A_21930 [Streptomyces phaeofaciens JCM 4814]|uniref:Uncharacterized protein n=1 Tax=Streptomyces phaeofaciens TaxID=68254 RepID=A0A918LPA2_9ACTN|nr:hypothetical protein GCM10010226_07280 [Streptomyces phaeofaciens]
MHKGWVKRLRAPLSSSTMRRKPPAPPDSPKSLPGQLHCLRHPDRLPEVQTCRAPRARRGADPAETGARIQRRNPPAPLPGTGAALTPVLTVKKGPADPSRGALRHVDGHLLRHAPPPPPFV